MRRLRVTLSVLILMSGSPDAFAQGRGGEARSENAPPSHSNGGNSGSSGGKGGGAEVSGEGPGNNGAPGQGSSSPPGQSDGVPSAQTGSAPMSQGSALNAVQAGEAVPLKQIKSDVERWTGGELIDAQLVRWQGRLVYLTKVLTLDGRVKVYRFLAKTGQPIP